MGKSFEKSTTQTSETVVVLVNKCLRSPHSILQMSKAANKRDLL